MRRHPGMGFKLLTETKQINEECRLIVLQHHERNDGTGYPRKLRGDDIHIYGRICSVADVFDALVSERPYRQKLKPFEALKLMRDEMLGHFQKEVFEKFVLLFK
jgi:HD-GYP domain-containing protein (c-di-GMP phosphodiesterase class II)